MKAAIWTVFILIALFGVAGGIDLIPLETYIQIRPAAETKGRVIAAANFAVFFGITIAAGALYLLNLCFLPSTSMGIIGIGTLFFSFWLSRRVDAIRTEELATHWSE
jgi:hypothetical protein